MPLAQRLALPAVWLLVIALFGVLEPDTFLTSANFQTIFGSQAVLAVLTLGLLLSAVALHEAVNVSLVLGILLVGTGIRWATKQAVTSPASSSRLIEAG